MRWLHFIKKSFLEMHLVDRCLMIFMTVLLIQSGFSIFMHEANSQEINMVDIAFRTTSAGIFGYFLSGNFNRLEKRKDVSPTVGNNDTKQKASVNHKVIDEQVIIATIIGLFSLMILIIIRNFVTITPNMIGTISQMRDFVSGCVGFLLGTPLSSNPKP